MDEIFRITPFKNSEVPILLRVPHSGTAFPEELINSNHGSGDRPVTPMGLLTNACSLQINENRAAEQQCAASEMMKQRSV